jgi:hypothetical protein
MLNRSLDPRREWLPFRITFMVYLPAWVDHKSPEIAIDPGSRIFESRINRIE